MSPRRLISVALVVALVAPAWVASSATPADAASWVPKWEHNGLASWNRSSSPTVADVNGDGVAEFVYGAQDGLLRVVSAATGNNLPHWPQQAGAAIDSTPAVADVDRDGHAEIVVGLGSTHVPNQHGAVKVFNHDGTVRCTYTPMNFGNIWGPGGDAYADAVFSSPALGDVDGDGRLDIVFGGFDLHLHAIDADCRSLAGFPYMVEDSTWASPALYDSDDDGRLEIFIGSDQTAGGAPQFDWAGGEFRALDVRNGAVHELWKRRSRDVFHSSPAIADIDGDGRMEVVTGGGNYYGHADGHKVWAFNIEDGSDVPGWPKQTGGAVFSSPALGDLNGDGRPEVVVGSRDGSVYAWQGNGALLWQRGPIANCCVNPPGPINASPIIADLDGDGDQDVAIGTNVAFQILDGRNGNVLGSAPDFGYSFENAAAVGDFGPAGRVLITSGFVTGSGTHRIAAYTLNSTVPSAWPMFHRDARNLGAPVSGGDPLPPGFCTRPVNPAPNPSSASGSGYWILGADGGIFTKGSATYRGGFPDHGITSTAVAMSGRPDGKGYWIVDQRGWVHSFGAAQNLGDMRGHTLNAPVIGVEPTPSGNGYWLLGRDGGIFTFGDARFYGSTGGMRLNAPVISMKSTPSGKGYWLLAADGGVFTFGDARFYGSTGGMRLNAPVISMAVNPAGPGYWLLGADGGVFTFGSATRFHGSVPGTGLCGVWNGVQIRPSATGKGYWVLASNGAVFSFGDAKDHGSQFPLGGANRAVDLSVIR